MIRNLFYSLFLHSFLFVIVYFSFHTSPPIEIEKTNKIAISFVVKSGNSENANKVIDPKLIDPVKKPEEKPQEKEIIPPKEKDPEPQPKKTEPKKTEPKKTEKKKNPEKSKEKNKQVKKEETKPNPKKEETKNKINKTKEEEKQKPKEEIKKEETKKEEADIDMDEEEYFEEDETDDPAQVDESDPYFFTENTIESLDLLGREKFNIHSQIKRCYKKVLSQEGKKSKSEIHAQIVISKEGFIDLNRVVILDFYKYSDQKEVDFKDSVDIVIKSLKFCNPIRNLPEDKYDIWKEISLKFDASSQDEEKEEQKESEL